MSGAPDIPRLRELLAKATAGPWELQNPFRIRAGDQSLLAVDILNRGGDWYAGEAEAKANAALITEAVNALPDLLALIESQQALVGEMAEALRLFPEAHDVLTRQEMRDVKGNWRSLVDQQTRALRDARSLLTRLKDRHDG